MKNTFVLDENVVISAMTLVNSAGERDHSCYQLVTAIIKNCHRIAYGQECYRRWVRHADRLLKAQTAIGLNFMKSFAEAARVDGKCPNWATNELSDEASWSTKFADDGDFVRLAVAADAILVTADGPLRKELTSGQAVHYAIRVMSPLEALEHAEPAVFQHA